MRPIDRRGHGVIPATGEALYHHAVVNGGTLTSKRILIIEDDPSSMRLMKYTLEHEGYQVLTATNGLEGLHKALSEAIDLVVLDIMLPGIDGYNICERLRNEEQTARLPIIMVSAKARGIDRDTGLKLGANDYVTKPWRRADLLARIGSMLG